MPGKSADRCPKAELHTDQPSGYLQWHAWAEQMAKMHEQRRCPGCDLFEIWIPKKPGGGDAQ